MRTLGWIGLGLLICLSIAAQIPNTELNRKLSDLLSPTVGTGPEKPLVWRASSSIEQPATPLPKFEGNGPNLKPKATTAIQPMKLKESTSLVSVQAVPEVPKTPVFATQPLLRTDTEDLRKPIPLPILAQPVKDRATLGDPTQDVSFAAALKPVNPTRADSTPFAPMNLPDPFEHSKAGRVTQVLDESPMPPQTTNRPPAK